jgi:hypothetical protein
MAGNQTANFVVKAKDQATGPLGKIGASMGKLKSTGISAFTGIASASAAAVAAVAAFAIAGIKAAADDERQTILLNAALKQRGLYTDDLNQKVKEQIMSMGALGIADDQVRAGLEVGSRFFKDQATLLKANSVAADIAAVTGTDLAEVMMTIGKGAQGQTRGLKALGIEVAKGATTQDILNAATAKYGGIAEELANSTSGKFAQSQVQFNETMESLGYALLPQVNKFMDWLVSTGMPAFQAIIDEVAPVLVNFIDTAVAPLLDSLGQLFDALGGAETLGTILAIAFLPLQIALQAIKIVIDAIIWGLKLIGVIAPGTGKSLDPMSDKYGNKGAVGTSYGAPGATTIVTNVSIGTQKVDTVVSDSLGRMATPGRNR